VWFLPETEKIKTAASDFSLQNKKMLDLQITFSQAVYSLIAEIYNSGMLSDKELFSVMNDFSDLNSMLKDKINAHGKKYSITEA